MGDFRSSSDEEGASFLAEANSCSRYSQTPVSQVRKGAALAAAASAATLLFVGGGVFANRSLRPTSDVQTHAAGRNEFLEADQAMYGGYGSEEALEAAYYGDQYNQGGGAGFYGDASYGAPAYVDPGVVEAPPPVVDDGLMPPSLPPIQRCSFSNEDCHETMCCSNVECDYLFQNCQGYTCYKKDQWEGGFAGCKTSPPGDWLGTVIGGPINPREIAPAPGNVQTQGTSLFCIAVVTDAPPSQGWQDPETVVAQNWQEKGLGILQCDDHMIIAGQPVGSASWGSVANIDAFIGYWNQVQADGRYQEHDWVVKVDADTVLLPDRLKQHLEQLRTPRGSPVLILNNEYKFQFLGAMEVFTKEAMNLYFENQDRCAAMGGHTGGEDYYMKACLLGIGVDIQKDFTILHDKYAAQDGCGDGWAAGFHFYKKASDWDACYQEAQAAAR